LKIQSSIFGAPPVIRRPLSTAPITFITTEVHLR
jgi:hypothetical protein